MSFTKLLLTLILLAAILVMAGWLYQIYQQKSDLAKQLEAVSRQLTPLAKENKKLIEEINYLKNEDNLEKELRARFNYVQSGEKLIIIVPKQSQQ